jgi:pimeloyl-ACP methyl ester carboxylesterase
MIGGNMGNLASQRKWGILSVLFALSTAPAHGLEREGAAGSPSLDGPGVASQAPAYEDHTRLLVVRDHEGREHPIVSRADWDVRRAHILAHFEQVAGPLPGGERRVPLDAEILESIEEPSLVRRKIRFAVEPGDRVSAWLLIPRGKSGPFPAMLCLHQTTAMGKDEPAGLGGLPNLHYARELAERGYVTLAPDYPGYGESRTDPYALGYSSATMKGVWNHLRAVDLLGSLNEVDDRRMGVIGHSLGGHNAIFVAMYEPRLKAVVVSCGFSDFRHYAGGDIAGWSHPGYMPRLRSEYALDLNRVPFDLPELLGVLAPRAVFVNAPEHDGNFPAAGVRVCVESATLVFALLESPCVLQAVYPDAGHDFPPTEREQAYRFLDRALAAGGPLAGKEPSQGPGAPPAP